MYHACKYGGTYASSTMSKHSGAETKSVMVCSWIPLRNI